MPSSSHAPSSMRHAVSVAFFANGFFVGSWTPQIPVFADRHDLSESAMGVMIFAFGAGAVGTMPLVGRVMGRTGSRRPMLALYLALAASLPFLAFAPNLVLAVAAIIFAGFATGGLDVAMNANAVGVERHLDRAIMSSCHGFWSLGGLAGAGAGGVLIAVVGAEIHALAVALLILVGWPIVRRRALADDGHASALASAGGAGASPASRASAAGYAKAITIGVFALFAMIPEGATIDWSAIYLRQDLGAGAAASGLAFAALSLSMAALRFAGDGLRHRFGAVRTMRACAAVATAGLLLVAFADGLALALVGFAVIGIGVANIVPIAFSAAGNVEGLTPGTGLSIATSLGYSGILVAPSVIGLAAETFGFSAVFASLALLPVLIIVAADRVKGADRIAGR